MGCSNKDQEIFFTLHPTLTHYYLPPTLRIAAVESQFWFP